MSLNYRLDMVKYASLIRLKNQTGTFLLLMPCILGLVVAHSFSLHNFLLFCVSAFLARSCGCIINDVFDSKIDAKVTTTQTRVVASGALTKKQAMVFCAVLVIVGLPLLFLFSIQVFAPLVVVCCLVVLYPFTKRFFSVPQLFLGIVYASGFIIAICHSLSVPFWKFSIHTWIFYSGLVLWIIFFDTIYAKRDFHQDIAHKIKSSTILFNTKPRICIGIILTITLLFIVGLFTVFLAFALVPVIVGLFVCKRYEFININRVLLCLCFLQIIMLSVFANEWYDYTLLGTMACLQVVSVFMKSQNGFKMNCFAILPTIVMLVV